MYEVGLDLRIKNGEIIFSYRGNDYVIRSHPYEPCTYICQGEEILHTLHSGFETSDIQKMILKDKEFRSVDNMMIGRNALLQIFAATIDDGRSELDFGYAERLAEMRLNKQNSNQEQPETSNTQSQSVKTYIYRGEPKREFFLIFRKTHELESAGIIIVPKDFENSWITENSYYRNWKVEVAPVSSQFVKGFNDPHWKVLKDNTGAEMNKYAIYQNPEGKIVADTPSTDLDIADTLEEYLAMPEEQIQKMCYRSEMSRAR